MGTSGPNDVDYDFDDYPSSGGSIDGTPTQTSSATGFSSGFSWSYSYGSGSFGISTGMAQFGTNGDAACTADASITFDADAGEEGEIWCETQSSLTASGAASFSSD